MDWLIPVVSVVSDHESVSKYSYLSLVIKKKRKQIELAVEKGLQPGRKSLKTGNKFNFNDGREVISDEEGDLTDTEVTAENTEWIVNEKPIPANPNQLPVGQKVALIDHDNRHVNFPDVLDDLEDGSDSEDVDDTEKAVNILTKLFSEKNEREKDEKLISNCSNDDLDREIKELKVKRLRSEIHDFEERNKERKAKRKERSERIKYYQTISQGFEKVIKAAEIVINNSNQGRNILEEAFHETVTSQCTK